MAQDRGTTHEQLDKLWDAAQPGTRSITVATSSRLAILSDLHLGDGGRADDMRRNHGALLAALRWYRENGFVLVLLGDIEELWQFELDEIVSHYGDTVYASLRQFPAGEVHRVFGNHDIEWRWPDDPATGASVATGAAEALRLEDESGSPFALLVHGHQGSTDSDRSAWISRFFVRIYGSIVEPLVDRLLGRDRHPSATKSIVVHDFEQVMYAWAKARRCLLVCGHSHRAVFGSQPFADVLRKRIAATRQELNAAKRQSDREKLKGNLEELRIALADEQDKWRDVGPLDRDEDLLPCYFNSGCGLYSDGLTAIELDGDDFFLVKWSAKPPGNRNTLVSKKLSLVRSKMC